MQLLRPSCRLGGLIVLLGMLVTRPAAGQDRGAPLFGPAITPDTVETGPFDLGRQWSFARLPGEYLRSSYDLSADVRDLRHVQRTIVRLPECTGTIVSPEGLVLTAARCVASEAAALADSLRSDAFLAGRPGAEPPLEGLAVERVVDVREVTARVDSLRRGEAADTNRVAWSEAAERVRRQLESDAPNLRVEIVREGAAERAVAYTYRRYEDVRLVFLPDRAVTTLGHVEQQLSYPQHTWDVAALRLYDGGQPLRTPDHLALSTQGVRPGDAVFSAGFPEELSRGDTHAQHVFRREVVLPSRVATLRAAVSHLSTFLDSTSAPAIRWREQLRRHRTALQEARARLDALRNPYFDMRLQARDDRLQDAASSGDVRSLVDEIAAVQRRKRAFEAEYRAFSSLLDSSAASATLRRALAVYGAVEGEASVDERPRIDSGQPAALDAALLGEHLGRFRAHLRPDSGLARALDAVEPTRAVTESVFSDPEAVQDLLDGGSTLPQDDPLVPLVEAIYPRYRSFRNDLSALQRREGQLVEELTRARLEAVEHPVALPAKEAPRLADGRVRGYEYNGTLAPAFTTFYGLYGAYASRPAASLPSRWQSPEDLTRSTPLTTVAGTDVIGEVGAPLLNESLQLVGIQVDGNVQSAAGAYLFLPDRMRTVALDARGLLEGLSAVYGADGLVRELRGTPAPSR